MSETSEVTGPTVKALKRIPGIDAWRVQSGILPMGGRYVHCAPPGTPDILVVIRGRVLYLEAKTETGKLSPVQVARHKELRSVGCRVEVIRSVKEAIAIVREMLE